MRIVSAAGPVPTTRRACAGRAPRGAAVPPIRPRSACPLTETALGAASRKGRTPQLRGPLRGARTVRPPEATSFRRFLRPTRANPARAPWPRLSLKPRERPGTRTTAPSTYEMAAAAPWDLPRAPRRSVGSRSGSRACSRSAVAVSRRSPPRLAEWAELCLNSRREVDGFSHPLGAHHGRFLGARL